MKETIDSLLAALGPDGRLLVGLACMWIGGFLAGRCVYKQVGI